MTAHRYWRALFPIGNSGGPSREFITISEMTMATAINGATVCSGGTAFAGNTLPGFPASNAFNGSTADFYSSNGGLGGGHSADTVNNYLGYDFGAGNEKDILDVRIFGYSTFTTDLPGWAIVQYSDDFSTWTSAWGIPSQSQGTGVAIGDNLAAGLVGGSRYQRILCTAPQSGNQIIMQEMTWITASGPGSTSAGFLFCARDINQDSTTGLYYQVGSEVTDQGGGNDWYSANTAGDHWVDFDFGAGNAPLPATIQMRAPAGGGLYPSMPATWKLQASADRSTWVDVQSFTSAAWTANNQLQTFTVTGSYPSASGVFRSLVTMA